MNETSCHNPNKALFSIGPSLNCKSLQFLIEQLTQAISNHFPNDHPCKLYWLFFHAHTVITS